MPSSPRRARRRGISPPPSVREVGHGFAMTEGLSHSGGAEPRPYTRLSKTRASHIRADVGIRPYAYFYFPSPTSSPQIKNRAFGPIFYFSL